ncbi:MAG: exo-alpha-sialidase [Euryarchaeota archaeon]|nr:exo-alpha-sialidase [Euryarchaeota archaeon]
MEIRPRHLANGIVLGVTLMALSQAVAVPFSDEFTSLDCEPACNIPATPGPANEVTIVVNPANPNNLIASAKDYTLSNGFQRSCTVYRVWAGIYYSNDAGASWNRTYIPGWNGTGPVGGYDCMSDPVLAFAGNGVAYHIGLPYSGADINPCPALVVHRSLDRGATWQFRSYLAFGPQDCADKQWAAVDTGGRLYIAWANTTGPVQGVAGFRLHLSYSDDGGASWVHRGPISLTDTTRQDQGVYVAIGPLGQIYATWRETVAGVIMFASSSNAGASWMTIPVGDCLCTGDFLLAETQSSRGYRFPMMPTMAVDTSGGANHGSIYIAYTILGPSQKAEVRVAASRTGGFDWTTTTPVNDQVATGAAVDGVGALTDDFMPAISVGPRGDIHIAYYSTREDGGFGSANMLKLNAFYAHSTNGLVWDPNVRLSTEAFDPALSHHQEGFAFMGDYIGISSNADRAHAIWADTRSGQPAAMTATVVR